ncbi:unnamed protein product [Caenorhabditis auriculariae]|uniref:GRIP domain-containing protein n=1 Tax=Caenorhabditis auriculariae TaxID=2777116 RepID=A0A8S1HV26_9PELO|nr:unnamed protein product [Caenorhabditis auriculariae]
MRNIISSSENDIGEFREQFKSLQVTMTSEREATQRESEALREEVASLQRQNQLLAEESRLVQEVNNQLKTRGDTELKRVELFEEKIRILEELRKELSEELDGTKTEVENLKKELETKKKELEVSQSVPLYFPPSDEPEGSVGALQSQIRQLNAQLREALMANSEKTDESGYAKNCVDEMIAQTNTLQIQQQIAAQATQELKQELLLKERQYLKVEQELVHERDHTADLVLVIRNLERIILGDDEGLEDDDVDEFANVPADMDCRASTSADSSTAAREAFEATSVNRAKVEELKRNSTTMKRYIRELKQKNEVQNAELEELKSQMENSTEEADATRSLLEKQLQEAEELDRGLLDGIEKRVAELEAELEDRRNALNEALKREKTQLRRVEELETECDLLKQQILDLTEKSPKPEESAAEVLEKMAEIEALKSKIALLENDVSVLTAEKQHQEAVQQEQLQKAPTEELHKENEELKKALVQKHGESVEYYTQLEAFAAKCAQLEAEAEQRTKKLAEVDGLYRSESDASEKKSRELDRLKQHLMLVEETSTREAVEAEQRETELRERVKELETLGSAATEDTSETIHMYQVRIETLKERLDSAQRYEAHWKSKFEAEQKAREQTQEALTSLQGVVRELSMDHERESAASSHRNLELQAEIETIGELRAELERHSLSRQSAEDDVERQKLQLEGKQKIIEELEVQIEEIRSTKSSKDTDSYRIDDGTLRQLFLNYFTAEPSKRADIALLLASILEYSPDDMEKVRKAVRQGNQSVASSFFGGGTRSSPGPSLTEQFVRFLEAESESARTAPHLPVRPASQPPQISLQGQASPNPQPPTSVTSPPSSAALDSLLR